MEPSVRAEIVTRRTYQRPLLQSGQSTGGLQNPEQFESWMETCQRVLDHQKWLWERAKGSSLTKVEKSELAELGEHLLSRKASVSGRTLWMGGTEVSKRREASQFNCAFTNVANIYDMVDIFWLLLNGCGVGFKMKPGILNGFTRPIEDVQFIKSTRTDKGQDHNEEHHDGETWTIVVGDSAEAWAKVIGKLLANKRPARALRIDFSNIRPAGSRLKGYGWICGGSEPFEKALGEIIKIANARAGQLLTAIDILDICNLLGMILSTRRASEIALMNYDSPEWEFFAIAKKDHFDHKPWRSQSNNSLLFTHKPSADDLRRVFKIMKEGGGSEPGIINSKAAWNRAPWFQGVNPCAEILLGDKSFCNLVEICLPKFDGFTKELVRALWLIARANYRQTCVDLDDGILQRSWHELNDFLRLTGVGVTGVVACPWWGNPQVPHACRGIAKQAVDGMADELGLPRSKLTTTVKPSGTLSKHFGTIEMEIPEGIHKPLGQYIFNWINFTKEDPIVDALIEANYEWMVNPYDSRTIIIKFPVQYKNVKFDKVDGILVNLESAVSQLNRYKYMMNNYVEHNCSMTVSYDESEVEYIIQWLIQNWDSYVGVSFLPRNDPTKTAADFGFPYLPQEVTTGESFTAYSDTLKPVHMSDSAFELDVEDCVGGVCPVR